MEGYVQKLEKSLATALDPRKLGPAAAGQSGLLGTPGGARSSAGATPGSSAKLTEVRPCSPEHFCRSVTHSFHACSRHAPLDRSLISYTH